VKHFWRGWGEVGGVLIEKELPYFHPTLFKQASVTRVCYDQGALNSVCILDISRFADLSVKICNFYLCNLNL